MKTIKFLRNSAGMGLVEVMMAVAVTGGLTLTIAKLMENASQSAKQVEAKSENTNLKGLVQDVLNNTDACKNTFYPVMSSANVTTLKISPTKTVTVPNIKDKLNVIRYSTASTNISPLTITSMEITNYNDSAFTGDLIINSTFKKSTNNIVMVKPIRIPINFSFTSGSVSACSTMAVGGEWLLGGNAGTVDGADYVGTSDTAPLNFRVNNQKSGRIDTVGQTFFGYLAGGNFNPYSTSGTGFGYEALKGNPFWNGAAANSAFGTGTLKSIVNGGYNTAIGWNALVNIYSSSYNTAVGAESQSYLTSGSSNTSLGHAAMKNLGNGSNNTAVGESALFNNGGNSNTGIGNWALMNNSSGNNNTALGDRAGYNLVTGSNNLFLGYSAGPGKGAFDSKLYIETTGVPDPLIGGDFSSAGRYVTINNKLGIGLNIGDVPASRLVVNGPNSPTSMGNAAYIASFYTDLPTEGMQAINAHVNPGSWTGWTQAGFFDSSTTGAIGGKSVGLRGRSYANVIGTTGRTFGVWGMAGNATPGWNYGVYGEVIGSNAGAGVFGTATEYEDGLNTTLYKTGKLAGFFHGDVVVTGNVIANAPLLPSDRRLKKNIKPLQNSLEKILKLEGVNFDWKQDTKIEREKKRQMGLIAQNVEEQFPLAVETTTNSSGEVKYVSYTILIAPIIESIKTLYAKILALITSDEKQNLEIKELKLENEKLKLEMKKQQESFDLRMKKLEAQSAKK